MKKRHEAGKANDFNDVFQDLPRLRGKRHNEDEQPPLNKRTKIKLEKEIRSGSSSHESPSSYYSSSSWNSRFSRQQKGKRGAAWQDIKSNRGRDKFKNKGYKNGSNKPQILERVSANSKVNFQKLSQEEMTQRYVNMFNELQALRATYVKAQKVKQQQEEKLKEILKAPFNISLLKARKVLSKHKFEMEDSAELLDQLVQALADKKLKCHSLQYSLICALIRKTLKKRKGPIALTQNLQSLFIESSKNELLSVILGDFHSVSDRSGKSQESETDHFLPPLTTPTVRCVSYQSGFTNAPYYVSSAYQAYNPQVMFAYQNPSYVFNQSFGSMGAHCHMNMSQEITSEKLNNADPKQTLNERKT